MKHIQTSLRNPDPPIIPPPSEDISTENTGPSPITITERPKIS